MKKISKIKLFYLIGALVFIVFAVILSVNFYNRVIAVYNPTDILSLSEKQDIDYNVYWRKDTGYEEEFREKGKTYVYNDIDYIIVTNKYFARLSEEINTKYNYRVDATLIIRTRNTGGSGANSIIWDKPYDIDQSSGSFSLTQTFEEEYEIKLDKYKKEAQAWAKNKDFQVSAEIRFDFIVELEGENERFDTKKIPYIRSLTIPLSDEVLKISLSDNEVRDNNLNVVNKSLFSISFFANSICIVLCFIIVFLAIQAFFISKSEYQATLDRYFKTYNDIIIKTNSPMNFDDYEILMIDDFKELLDLSVSSNNPVMFYETEIQGGLFYILFNNMVYLHVLSRDKKES